MRIKKSRQGQSPNLRIKTTTRRIIIAASFTSIVAGVMIFIFHLAKPIQVKAVTTTTTLPSGSFIVNMGNTNPTNATGLYPYGMVYDMITRGVPVNWVISPTKLKDSVDFTYNGVKYSGGPFIIGGDHINATITSRISYWVSQGVQGVYTTGAISVPVYATITNFPTIIIDTISNNQNIIEQYFTDANIPLTAYAKGSPSELTYCSDLWVNPHADPTWTTHGYLYNFVTVAKSYVWSECHSVSVLESLKNPASPYQQLNFLTVSGLQCYSNNNCGTITQSHNGGSNSPYSYYYPNDAVMQFMGTLDQAVSNGSESWYIPLTTGGWNSATRQLVTTTNGTSPSQGALAVYGPAYGNTSNGWVMYEAGHQINSGPNNEQVAAQRAFLNFVLLAGIAKQIVFNTYVIPTAVVSNNTYSVSVSVSAGSPAYSYAWSSTVGGTFTSTTAASTIYTAPNSGSSSSGVITCTVTDACGRTNFISIPMTLNFDLPVSLLSFSAKKKNSIVEIDWATASEINNNYFTVERSNNGIDYSELLRKPGAGTSTIKHDYSGVDDAPKEGMNYYRLKQTDFNGDTVVYPPKVVESDFNKNTNIAINSIGPNPFKDNFNINFSVTSPGNVDVQIMNASGQMVYKETITSDKGINTYSFTDDIGLPSGLYIVNIINNGEIVTEKMIKK